MKVLDFTIGVSGKRVALTNEGLFSEDAPPPLAYAHLPQNQRPSVCWNRIPGPEGVELSRVFLGAHGAIVVLGEGRLYERVRDTNLPLGINWRWQELKPGENDLPAVNPPAVVRTEVLRVSAATGEPVAPEPKAPVAATVTDTFEARKVAGQQSAIAELVAENARLRAELTTAQKRKSK